MSPSNATTLAPYVTPFITFVLGVITTVFTQLITERRQRAQITYSKKTEKPLKVAKEELKEKIKLSYQSTKIDELYAFNLRIANTGKKTIENQIFTCSFAEGTLMIDPKFPDIKTMPKDEVGPVEPDTSVKSNNKFRYTIKVLGVGQMVDIDFLTTNNRTPEFEVSFRANGDVKFIEGSVSGFPTLELHVRRLLAGAVAFYMITLTAQFFPYPIWG